MNQPKLTDRFIEEAAMNAWPALQQNLYDGWVLRFSEGYTKRANSVNPLYDGILALDEKVAYCEQLYTKQSLPTIFRLTSPLAPAELDLLLEKKRYKILDPTIVMSLELDSWHEHESTDLSFQQYQLDPWLQAFSSLSGYSLEKQPIHGQMLGSIISPCLLATLQISGKPITCGLGVLQGEYYGLFDIVTHPDHRNQGYGRIFITKLLNWAQNHGARCAYLQVMENNAPARHLYNSLGFEKIYHYWYRVPEDN